MFRERNSNYSGEEKIALHQELLSIIDKPVLDPELIWKISSGNFYEWRKKHDLPIILAQLKIVFKHFVDWQNDQDISDEMLLTHGISNCVESNYSTTAFKVILKSKASNSELEYVVPEVEIYHATYYQEAEEAERTVVKRFLGYFDWCKSKGREEHHNRIIDSFSYTDTNPGSGITFLNGLQLLKVGDITLSGSKARYNSKYFEFVDIDNLTLTGEYFLVGFPLAFVNSIGRNITLENFKGAYFHFAYSYLSSVNILNSELHQSNFFLTDINADITNSLLRMSFFYGDIFNVNFNASRLWDFNIRPARKQNFDFSSFYKNIKNVYAGQGDESKAIEYFVLEKEVERKLHKFKITNQYSVDRLFHHKEFELKELIWYHLSSFFSFLEYSFSYHFWGYGHKPLRVLRTAMGVIFVFAVFYFMLGDSHFHVSDASEKVNFANALYFSVVSFTTLGYGDFYIIGGWKLLSAFEALLGASCLGFLVAGYANNKY